MRDGGRNALPWILLGLVVAAVLGFVAARMLPGSRPSNTAPDFSNPNGSAAAPPPSARPTTGADGGNWPTTTTVEAPPMTLPTPPAGAPGNGAGLTGMARAFLARPERDAAMQAALREKAAKLPGLCPALAFVPGDTLIARTPPPMFDSAGTMRRGLIRQRFTGTGCANAQPRFNIWIFAEGPDAPVKTVAGYMGATHADPALQRDATPIVFGIAARALPGCTAFSVIDTRLPGGNDTPATPGPWREEWLVAGCGRFIQLGIRFVPEPSGITRIEVPQSEAKPIG